MPDTLPMLSLILTGILKYCTDEKVKVQRGLELSQGHRVIIKTIIESMFIWFKNLFYPPLGPLSLHRRQWEHERSRREGEKMIAVDIGGLLSFPGNSAFSFIGEWLLNKGSTHPPSPGPEGWSKAWPIITLSLHPQVNDCAYVCSHANLSFSHNFYKLKLGERNFCSPLRCLNCI